MKKTTLNLIAALILNFLLINEIKAQSNQQSNLNSQVMQSTSVHYRNIKVNGLNLFYREAGPTNAPTILLLHGYPTSSHMFTNLIPILSKNYHVIAPDLPGFGYSDAPDHDKFNYTFDNLAATMQGIIDELGMKRFAIYIFDYGAPPV